MAAVAAASSAGAGEEERSASYIVNLDDPMDGGPGTPTTRSVSMAAGLDEASQKGKGGGGGVRKRFTSLKVRVKDIVW